MERAQAGDKEAFQDLFADIGPVLTRVVRRRVRDPAETEDVCQEVLLAVFKSRHTYEPSRRFEPRLFAIVRNVLAGHLRRTARWASLHELVDEIIGIDNESSLALELNEALRQLSPIQLEAVQLTKLSGLSVEEAAKRTVLASPR